MREEAHIIMNGKELTKAESTVVRVALESFAVSLGHGGAEALGEIGPLYVQRLDDIRKKLY